MNLDRSAGPILSIITVCYNADTDLARTIKSVSNLISNDIEYIIIDGKSNDSTSLIINENIKSINYWVSEPDNGIFDAMNKGIKASNGKWLIFLNAGDEARFGKDILDLLNDNYNFALIYGDTERNDGSVRKPHSLDLVQCGGLPMCHQSTFYNRDIIKDEMMYLTTHKLFMEVELFMRLYVKNFAMKYVQKTFSFFQGGGISEKIIWNTRKARYYYLYKHFGLKGILRGMSYKIKNSI